jgi:chromosome segregation protein
VYLKRLEIQGFKTFANHTVFEFRPGITAIVGPNGSGKSNISDAVRWVLGEQSYATLRSKKSEDVIFGGSARRAPAGFAQVSLTIDNADRLLPLPYNEVTFTRRYTRSGDSEYMINRSRVRLRDIHEAIGRLGSSYTIINQGLVDSALTLRPEERRRLFEDAAEIGLYTTRKAETEGRLRETNANVERCADILAEIEPRMRSLKRQASLARTHRELSTELRELLERFYTHAWHSTQQQRQHAEQAAHALETELEARRAAQAAATAALRAQRDTVRQLREQLVALHTERDQLQRQAETAERDLAVNMERAHALARSAEEAAQSQRELATRREELQHERAAIEQRIAAATERLQEAQAAVAAQQHAMAAHEAERRAARQRLDAAQREELAATAALNALKQRMAQTLNRRATLDHEMTSQAEALARAEQALAARRDALHEAEQRLHDAIAARQEAAAAEEHARAEQTRLREERARADEAVAAARRTLADLEARLESLSRLQRSYAGTFAGVKAAMQWAEQERRAGFALVSSLVRTPAEYETAVEVALGSRLQNIVVERWEDAEDAIAALKRSGTGRATFLPLDTLRQPTIDERRWMNDDVLGVAAALMEYDPHYKNVIWSLLGRTLIVRDLATARQQVRQLSGGWTIVTLAGEQVNSGGALTGGAQIKEAGVLRRERELRELPQQISAAQQTMNERAAARAAIDQQLAAAEQAIRAATEQRRRANSDHDNRRAVAEQARRAAEQADAALDKERRRHEQIAAEHTALNEQATALQHEHAALEARERAAQAALAELRAAEQGRDDEERAAQAMLAELRAAVAAVEGELRADRALLQAHEQQVSRIQTQQRSAEQRATELERDQARIVAQMEALQTSRAALAEQIAALQGRIDPAEAEQTALEAQGGALEQREADSTAALLEAESAHSRAAVELQRAQDRLETLWERAAGDDIDIEALTTDHRPPTTDQAVNLDDLQSAINNLKSRITRLGAVNPLALEEYEEESQRHAFLSTQLNDLREAADGLRALIAELEGAMQLRFETTFTAIAAEFAKCFVRLFGGGEARLTMTSALAETNGNHDGSLDDVGVEIVARPPGKRLQTLSLLSGGERALTASALLFAILNVNPSPFCILDEVDAALDEANVGRFRELLTDMTQQTQFLLVTHNRATIEAADTIYGISMGDDGASRVLSLRLEELVEE